MYVGRFFLDLCSSVPIDWFIVGVLVREDTDAGVGGSAASLTGLLRIFKVLKLLRLLRLARVMRFFARFEDRMHLVINANTLRMTKLFAGFVIYVHWMASVLFIMTASVAAFPDDSWPALAGIVDADQFTQYTWSVYSAVLQMFGEPGVVSPVRTVEIWISLLALAMGATLYASVLAAITRVIGEMSPASREFRYKVPRSSRDRAEMYRRDAHPARRPAGVHGRGVHAQATPAARAEAAGARRATIPVGSSCASDASAARLRGRFANTTTCASLRAAPSQRTRSSPSCHSRCSRTSGSTRRRPSSAPCSTKMCSRGSRGCLAPSPKPWCGWYSYRPTSSSSSASIPTACTSSVPARSRCLSAP